MLAMVKCVISKTIHWKNVSNDRSCNGIDSQQSRQAVSERVWRSRSHIPYIAPETALSVRLPDAVALGQNITVCLLCPSRARNFCLTVTVRGNLLLPS